jgi:hypothetical protein
MIAYDRLSQIIPADQALANKALSVSLQQLAGISTMTLPVLANTIANLQTTKDLPLISALTQAVPPAVANYISNIAGTAGTPFGVCDVLGIAAGYQVTGYFNNTVSTLATTNVAYLTTIYQTMNNVVGNVYGDPILGPVTIPAGLPAAGTYYPDQQSSNVGNTTSNVTVATAADVAFTGATDPDSTNPPPTGPGLIPVATTEIGNVVVANAPQVANLNSYFNSMANQVVSEHAYQAKSQIQFANLVANSATSVYSLIYSLPTYGTQTEQGGLAQFWQGVADQSTFTGQAIVGAMREGINQARLNSAGIATNSTIPADANPPTAQANLIPATYTAQQAANAVIK